MALQGWPVGKDEVGLDRLTSQCRGRANSHAYEEDLVFAAKAPQITCQSDLRDMTQLVQGVCNTPSTVMTAL